ncbi:MAG TPA: type II toxin-antitoxin system VapC family toxin [Methanolinea sp.]|nr:type II toxin-antitoxin system VapC family toxin [Methanolinea sp.]
MSIVDTCFLIDLIREDPGAIRYAEDEAVLRTTAISAAEFLYGARISMKPDLADAARTFLSYFPILPFDSESAALYADIAAELRRSGRRISSFDELIAAIALRHDEAIVSRDTHFSSIPGLSVISY